MGEKFNRCVKRGGRVRRKSKGSTYQNFCFIGGQSYAGEVKRKKGGRKR